MNKRDESILQIRLKKWKEKPSGKIFHLAGEIIIVLWCLIIVVMIGWVFLASFSTTREIFTNRLLSKGFTLKGYNILFTQYEMGRYFLNTFFYTAVACVGLIFFGAPAAYALTNYNFRGKKIINSAYASAMGIPGIMLIAPLFAMFAYIGLSHSIASLLLIYIGTGVPATVFYLGAFFSTSPREIQEAALIDGCSHIRSFWLVVMPLAQPGILTVTIFNFIGYWNEYIWALTICNTPSIKTISVALQAIVQGMGNTGNYTGLFAGVVCVFVPTFIFFILLSDYIMGDITSGAVKG